MVILSGTMLSSSRLVKKYLTFTNDDDEDEGSQVAKSLQWRAGSINMYAFLQLALKCIFLSKRLRETRAGGRRASQKLEFTQLL